jgi:hypothetical protein
MAQVYGFEHAEPITVQNVKDTKYALTSMAWKARVDDLLDKAIKMLWEKRQYLEHCINFLQDDSIHYEDGTCWISSPNKRTIEQLTEGEGKAEFEDRIYITKDSPKYLLDIALNYYYCTLYRDKLPGEISILEDTVAYLYGQLE